MRRDDERRKGPGFTPTLRPGRTRRFCAVCAERVPWPSAFLFEGEALMHARCWPPLRRLLEQVAAPAEQPSARDTTLGRPD
jgi:hypothetical protein